ncbi:MAG: GNAT family N-acetyltransferase [Pseudomonadota bacterium]
MSGSADERPASGPLTIRRLTEPDAAQFREIRLEALRTAPDAFAASLETEAAKDLAQFEARLIRSHVFGAFEGTSIIGMAGYFRQSGEKLAHKGVVWGMFVRPESRKSGVGHALLIAVIAEARKEVEVVNLTVGTENHAALALYRSLGFEVYGVEPDALKTSDGYLSETLMTLRF